MTTTSQIISRQQLIARAYHEALAHDLIMLDRDVWLPIALRNLEHQRALGQDQSWIDGWEVVITGPAEGLQNTLRAVDVRSDGLRALCLFEGILSLHRMLEVIGETLSIRYSLADRAVWLQQAEGRLLHVHPHPGAS